MQNRKHSQRHEHHRNHPVGDYVQETLAAADPFYRGPHRGSDPHIDEPVSPLNWDKTARDLGHVTDPSFPAAAGNLTVPGDPAPTARHDTPHDEPSRDRSLRSRVRG